MIVVLFYCLNCHLKFEDWEVDLCEKNGFKKNYCFECVGSHALGEICLIEDFI